MLAILGCAQAGWLREVGDTLPLGLALTTGYVLATLAMLAALFARPPVLHLPHERLLWGVATVVVVVLSLNKQLDLQLFTARLGRCLTRGGADMAGFDLQYSLALWFLALAAAGIIALMVACRRALADNAPLLFGLGLIALFLILRVSRLEHLGWLSQSWINYNRLHRLIEGAGLVVLIFAALRKYLSKPL